MNNQIFHLKKYFIGGAAGFLLGLFLLHPLSMILTEAFQKKFHWSLKVIIQPLSPHHFPMGIYFGFIGMVMGMVIIFLLITISHEKEHIKALEGLLPICSYCKKIRDDTGKGPGTGEWEKLEKYISKRSAASFSHGICPDCYKKEVEPKIK